MSEKDVAAVEYFEDAGRFADLLNVHLFHGKQVVRPEGICKENRSYSLPRGKKESSIVVSRDVVREVSIQMKATIIALESQSDIHYAMPVRVLCGDGVNYHSQWRKRYKKHKEKSDLKGAEYVSGFSKTDKLIPVYTIVIYFGEKPWDGPRCLKDMLDLDGLPKEVQEGIVDYPIRLLEVRRFTDYEQFQTDLKWVFGFLQRDTDEDALKAYVEKNRGVFADMSEDTYRLISEFSHSHKLETQQEFCRTKTGGVDMCKAINDMIASGEARGEARGMERGIERGIQGMVRICKDFGASIEMTISKIMGECALTEEKATEYVQKYWN